MSHLILLPIRYCTASPFSRIPMERASDNALYPQSELDEADPWAHCPATMAPYTQSQSQGIAWSYANEPAFDPASHTQTGASMSSHAAAQDSGYAHDGYGLHSQGLSHDDWAAASSSSAQQLGYQTMDHAGGLYGQATLSNFHMSNPGGAMPPDSHSPPPLHAAPDAASAFPAGFPESSGSVDTATDDRFTCPVCFERKGAARDVRRHLWVRHPEYASQNQVRSEKVSCPYPGCRHTGRKDNVNRHMRTKHGDTFS